MNINAVIISGNRTSEILTDYKHQIMRTLKLSYYNSIVNSEGEKMKTGIDVVDIIFH